MREILCRNWSQAKCDEIFCRNWTRSPRFRHSEMVLLDATQLQLKMSIFFEQKSRYWTALAVLVPALLLMLSTATSASAQESPYIVTYDHYLEEPGNLEVEYFSTFGT